MTNEKAEEQKFLKELESTLWKSADKLRTSLDAAQYKHVVLGLIFVKYISDSFEDRKQELSQQFNDKDHYYYIYPQDYQSEAEREQAIKGELEERDYYTEKNVFWVPQVSRWEFLQDRAPQALGDGFVIIKDKDGKIEITSSMDAQQEHKLKEKSNKVKRITSVGGLIDHALSEIETENPKLKSILNKNYAALKIEDSKLKELINLLSNTKFQHKNMSSKDILGHVYEYMLGQFALAEGRKGGQYYTPASIVSLIVEMIEPFKGRVYDPAMGSGGFFVQSDKFITRHAEEQQIDPVTQKREISIYGQEYNHTTWQLAAMNMAIRNLDYSFGNNPACSFKDDKHKGLEADFIMANPPFNMREWQEEIHGTREETSSAKERFNDDPRWKGYPKPPSGNANFAWMLHMLHHLNKDGSQALLLANGSMSSMTNNEGDIRKQLITEDRIECMVALPSQLFINTQIPACIWFLTKNKTERTDKAGRQLRNREREVLFIDMREMGYMKDRVLRDFEDKDINYVANLYHSWKTGKPVNGVAYDDKAGFCKSATIAEIEKHDYVLTPGRYVGAAPEEDDGIPFADKMQTLTKQLSEQLQESNELEAQIKASLKELGYEI